MKHSLSIMVVLCLVLSGCATARHVELDERGSDRLLLVSKMTEDDRGRPIPGKYVKHRPTKVGEKYTAVLMRDGLPFRSFDIAITKPGKPDFYKPLEVVGTYTYKGAALGVGVGLVFLLGDSESEDGEKMSDDEAKDRATLAAISIAAGTAIGIVVGVAKSAPVIVEQVNLLTLRSEETLMTYSEYEYDGLRRLCLVRRHANDGRLDHIVTTEFSYEGASDAPSSSETSSDYVYRDSTSGI